eukprot:1679549-Amphidinium_carterae.1
MHDSHRETRKLTLTTKFILLSTEVLDQVHLIGMIVVYFCGLVLGSTGIFCWCKIRCTWAKLLLRNKLYKPFDLTRACALR